jgi:hypothetical protein
MNRIDYNPYNTMERKGIGFTELNTIHYMQFISLNVYNSRSRRWGSSLTVCARLTVRSSPHRHERKFSGAHVCRVTFKHLHQPLRSHIWSFGTLGQLFKIPPFSARKSHSTGVRGVPDFFLVGIIISLLLRSPCKITKSYDSPFWEN